MPQFSAGQAVTVQLDDQLTVSGVIEAVSTSGKERETWLSVRTEAGTVVQALAEDTSLLTEELDLSSLDGMKRELRRRLVAARGDYSRRPKSRYAAGYADALAEVEKLISSLN